MTEPTRDHESSVPERPTPLQRVLMNRAREQAERARERHPRRPGQVLVSVAFALVVVAVIAGGINAFLTAMQRTMRMMEEQEKAQEAKREEEQRKQPMPAYVVPDQPAPKE